jgi:sirohydrochlorin ferrochelatase
MQAVLILAHGSREDETERTMKMIMSKLKASLTDMDIVEECYMQFRAKNVQVTLDDLVSRGATEIFIIPYFLFEGIHIKEDIPAEIETFKESHPNTAVHFGRSLGYDGRIVDVLQDRVRELMLS